MMNIKMRCPFVGTTRFFGIIMTTIVTAICMILTSFTPANSSTEPFVIHIESIVENEGVNARVNNTEEVVETPICLGEFKITAYCKENYPHICNNGDSSTTSTGTTPTVGRTIAVDPSKIPYGSKVIIDGHTYTAEDCGGGIKGNRIDILFATHQEALEWGVQYKDVQIIK